MSHMRVPELPPSMTSTYSGPRCLEKSTAVSNVKACRTQANLTEICVHVQEGRRRMKQLSMTCGYLRRLGLLSRSEHGRAGLC